VNGGDMSLNARLMNDIVINENVLDSAGNLNEGTFKSWTPISDFRGFFDGNNHVIKGLYIPAGGDKMGFISSLSDGKVSNLGIEDSYMRSTQGRSGGIAGQLWGVASIVNSYYIGVVSCNGGQVGGITSSCNANAVISNCYFVGKLIEKKSNKDASVCTIKNGTSIIENCYAMSFSEPADSDLYRSFKSGKIAFLLQKGQIKHVWGQKLGVDPLPVLGADALFPIACTSESIDNYSNILDTNLVHNLDDHNVCTTCGYRLCEQHVYDHCVCTYCGYRDTTCVCEHEYDHCTCIYCGDVSHNLDHCVCTTCGYRDTTCVCEHVYDAYNHCVCTYCGYRDTTCVIKHMYDHCICTYCGLVSHEFENCYCRNCALQDTTCTEHIHKYEYGYCLCGEWDSVQYWFDIYTVEDLYDFARRVNVGNVKLNARLMNDIEVNSVDWSVYDKFIGIKPMTFIRSLDDSIRVWTGIDLYKGTFDGQNNVITGLCFDSNGFFEKLSNATIKNLGMENCRMISLNGEISNSAGIISGMADTCLFSNCHTSGMMLIQINGSSFIAGLVGDAINVQFDDCYNLATIDGYRGSASCSGIVGVAERSTVENLVVLNNCWNAGSVKSEGEMALGGLLSSYFNYGKVFLTNCYNIGEITGSTLKNEVSSGGLVSGVFSDVYLSSCYNAGRISMGDAKTYADALVDNSYGLRDRFNFNPEVQMPDISDNDNEWKRNVFFHNCYYLDNCVEVGNVYPYPDSLDVHAMSEEQFANGEACFRLNKGVTDGTQPYYQDLEDIRPESSRSQFVTVDPYPVLDKTHRTVYTDGTTFFNVLQSSFVEDSKMDISEPNVYVEDFTIKVTKAEGRVLLSDMNGRTLFSKRVQSADSIIEIPVRLPGAYLLIVSNRPYKVVVR
jgi:hypothetical protein